MGSAQCFDTMTKTTATTKKKKKKNKTKKKRRRHKDDILDEDVENQQPSPHPMPPIILRQAFLHAPNTFKPVSHIGAITSCYKFFNIIFPYIVPKPKLYLCKFFTIIFPYIVPKPKLYLYKFLPLYFRTMSQTQALSL